MTKELRRYLFVQSTIGSAIANAVINGAIGVAMMWKLPELPVWKIPGVAPDLVATAFGVAFGTCLGTFLQVKTDLAAGRVALPEGLTGSLSAFVSRFPSGLLKRAIALGIVATPVFALPVIATLFFTGTTVLDKTSVVALKVTFSAAEGVAIVPFIVLAALLDRTRARA